MVEKCGNSSSRVFAILAAIIGALLPLFFLADNSTQVNKVIPAIVSEGERFDILGNNLDLVGQIILRSSDSTVGFGVNSVFRTESRFTLELRLALVPGKYGIELRTNRGQSITTGRSIIVTRSPFVATSPPPTPTPTLEPTPLPDINPVILALLTKQSEVIDNTQEG